MDIITASASVHGEGLNIILLIGIAIFGGTVGARLFQRLNIPRIVGFVAIGIVLGPVLRIIEQRTIADLEPFNIFALGIIGFLIGGELRREIFTRFGRQVIQILLFEGLAAFSMVGTLSFLVMISFTGEWKISLATAVVFGAICAATDPASTMSVLWEYKARGPLTSMLTAIVALDDALALTLYTICVSIAGVIMGGGEVGFASAMLTSVFEIVGSVVVGLVAGFVLNWILKRTDEPERVLIFCISAALLIIGVALTHELDVIIATMTLGVVLVNVGTRKVVASFELVHRFAAPLYVLFFVLVGARLRIADFSLHVVLLALAYIVGSVIGKTSGAWLGAKRSRSVPTIRKYLGFCLYQQGTIAIALLLMASSRFEGDFRDTMLSVIVSGVFVFQLIGPVFVKIGSKKAGEAGMNITEEDLMRTYKVEDVMDKDVPTIRAGMPLCEVLNVFSSTDRFYYPVTGEGGKLIGAVTMDGIRNTFSTQELNDWLVALDIAEPILGRVEQAMPLADALEKAKQLEAEYLPVVSSSADAEHVGILSTRLAHRRLAADVLAKQKECDMMYLATQA